MSGQSSGIPQEAPVNKEHPVGQRLPELFEYLALILNIPFMVFISTLPL